MGQVYYAPLNDNPSVIEQETAVKKLMAASNMAQMIEPNDFVAIKLHVGEENNTTHVKPELIKVIVEAGRSRNGHVFLTETSTLYRGERENAVKHILLAHQHGFGIEKTGAPWVMADGLTGGAEVAITVNGELDRSVKIAREIAFADVLIAVSHPTGHEATGLGACFKNLGMGLASRAGKLRQHSSMRPEVDTADCVFCRKCLKWCPAEAIVEQRKKAYIIPEKCIGCGECLTVCRNDAVKYNWGIQSETLQKSMVEHALGVIKDKTEKCFYFNVLVGMTADCDCYGVNQPKIMPDLGIIASRDPVAIDKATLDLTEQAQGNSLAQLSHRHLDPFIQLKHAVKLGMGRLEYELVRV